MGSLVDASLRDVARGAHAYRPAALTHFRHFLPRSFLGHPKLDKQTGYDTKGSQEPRLLRDLILHSRRFTWHYS